MKATGERWERRRWRIQRPERVAAVDKIEEKRKPENFIGHRNRDCQKSGRFGENCDSKGNQKNPQDS